jgi:hypothetical protein
VWVNHRTRVSGSARGVGRRRDRRGPHEREPNTDHDEIRRWAEERDAVPSVVRDIHDEEGSGILRFDMPGCDAGEYLEEVTWDEFFEFFETVDWRWCTSTDPRGRAELLQSVRLAPTRYQATTLLALTSCRRSR